MQNQKLISNSPPRNKFLIDNKVTVKRPPSNGRQTAVAKIYNQNNRLVVQLPRRNFR